MAYRAVILTGLFAGMTAICVCSPWSAFPGVLVSVDQRHPDKWMWNAAKTQMHTIARTAGYDTGDSSRRTAANASRLIRASTSSDKTADMPDLRAFLDLDPAML